MERVIKRYLMHNQGEVDDLKLNDFDELKQELQMMKHEFINDIFKSKDDILKNVFFLTNSIKFIAEDILLNNLSTKNSNTNGSGDETNASNTNTQSSFEKYKNLMNLNESLLNSPIIVDEPPPTTGAGKNRSSASSGDSFVLNNDMSETTANENSPGKSKFEFIDNFLGGNKSASPSSKVSFDKGEPKFFPSSGSLYKIVEESTSMARSERSVDETWWKNKV